RLQPSTTECDAGLLARSHPAKRAVEQRKCIEFHKLELHVNPVIVHVAVEYQLVGCRSLKSETGLPCPAGALRQRNGHRLDVDGRAVVCDGIVDTLKGDRAGGVKDNATPPPIVVIEGNCGRLSVD